MARGMIEKFISGAAEQYSQGLMLEHQAEVQAELEEKKADILIKKKKAFGAAKAKFQKTESFLVRDPVTQEQSIATGLVDVDEGTITTVKSPIGGDVISKRTGETVEEKEQREVRTEGSKERAKLEAKKEIEPEIAKSKEIQKAIAARLSDRIEIGVGASKGIPILKRSLELLEKIETGGVEALTLDIKKRMGWETADEGELSYLFSKNVLSQLRTIFGAAFTQKEGERLADIEAGFGKSTAANKRMLGQLLRIAEADTATAIKDAEAIEDTATRDALIEKRDFSLSDSEYVGMFKKVGNAGDTTEGGVGVKTGGGSLGGNRTREQVSEMLPGMLEKY